MAEEVQATDAAIGEHQGGIVEAKRAYENRVAELERQIAALTHDKAYATARDAQLDKIAQLFTVK